MALDRRISALPAETTSFVGREAELAEYGRVLSEYRLLTLTGEGGIGKTRLAQRLAADKAHDFRDGVLMVDVSRLPDPDLLPHIVTMALSIQDTTTRPMLEVLTDYLQDRSMLLFLDGSEGLGGAGASLVVHLLRAAPDVKILVASRVVLAVVGEHVRVVPPLAVTREPSADGRVPDAVALFADRARAADPGFRLTDANRRTVQDLCARLDGLPLAIELAAGRLTDMTVEHVAASLDDRFALLSRDAPETEWSRHDSLRTTVGWSHELCEPAERLLWARLSIFPTTFDLPAVEAVCADERLPADAVVALLARLVDKSILRAEHDPDGMRYRFLDTIRQFGRDWLQSLGEYGALRRRHRDHFLTRAEHFDAEWFGPEQTKLFAGMRREHANLRAALEFSLTGADEDHGGFRLASTLWAYWGFGGLERETRLWLERLLAHHTAPSIDRARALWTAGYIASHQIDLDASTRWLTDAREMATELDDTRTALRAGNWLGLVALHRGEFTESSELISAAVAGYANLDVPDEACAALALTALAAARIGRGDLTEANHLLADAERRCEARGDRIVLGMSQIAIGRVAWVSGDLARAESYAGQALELCHDGPMHTTLELSLHLLTWIADSAGDHQRAAVLIGAHRAFQSRWGNSTSRSAHHAHHRDVLERTRKALGRAAYDAALRRGESLDADQLIAYATRIDR